MPRPAVPPMSRVSSPRHRRARRCSRPRRVPGEASMRRELRADREMAAPNRLLNGVRQGRVRPRLSGTATAHTIESSETPHCSRPGTLARETVLPIASFADSRQFKTGSIPPAVRLAKPGKLILGTLYRLTVQAPHSGGGNAWGTSSGNAAARTRDLALRTSPSAIRGQWEALGGPGRSSELIQSTFFVGEPYVEMAWNRHSRAFRLRPHGGRRSGARHPGERRLRWFLRAIPNRSPSIRSGRATTRSIFMIVQIFDTLRRERGTRRYPSPASPRAGPFPTIQRLGPSPSGRA